MTQHEEHARGHQLYPHELRRHQHEVRSHQSREQSCGSGCGHAGFQTRQHTDQVTRDQYQRSERGYGTFQRSFSLSSTVDASRVIATYQDGVLTVTLPRREDTRPRQIQVTG